MNRSSIFFYQKLKTATISFSFSFSFLVNNKYIKKTKQNHAQALFPNWPEHQHKN